MRYFHRAVAIRTSSPRSHHDNHQKDWPPWPRAAGPLSAADSVQVHELEAHVIDQMRKLTEGGQNPMVRRENLECDFAVY